MEYTSRMITNKPEVEKKIKYGKPIGATSFVAIPAEKYNGLTSEQKDQIRFFDPFLRLLQQDGIGLVYVFWITESQLNCITQ